MNFSPILGHTAMSVMAARTTAQLVTCFLDMYRASFASDEDKRTKI